MLKRVKGYAGFSKNKIYRYWLTRDFESLEQIRDTVLFVMLNPSTANAEFNDPTILRCMNFADSWSMRGLVVVNLYALRSTDPKNLWKHNDPVGPDNDEWLRKICRSHQNIVCAWGNNAKRDRVDQFVELVGDSTKLICLGTNKNGSPKHPLYIKSGTKPVRWTA